MKDCSELCRRRGAIIKDMRVLTDKADAEKREPAAEESEQYSRMEADQEQLRVEIEREERHAALDRELESFAREPGRMPKPASDGERNAKPRATDARRAQFSDMLCRSYRPGEHRTLQADSQVEAARPRESGHTLAINTHFLPRKRRHAVNALDSGRGKSARNPHFWAKRGRAGVGTLNRLFSWSQRPDLNR